MANRTRKRRIEFYITDEEYEMYTQKMVDAGYGNMSAFIRNCVEKHSIIKVDLNGVYKVAEEMNAVGKNVNQIARICNMEQSVFLCDVEDLQKEMNNFFLKINNALDQIHDLIFSFPSDKNG